jgi:hypothetical protein
MSTRVPFLADEMVASLRAGRSLDLVVFPLNERDARIPELVDLAKSFEERYHDHVRRLQEANKRWLLAMPGSSEWSRVTDERSQAITAIVAHVFEYAAKRDEIRLRHQLPATLARAPARPTLH